MYQVACSKCGLFPFSCKCEANMLKDTTFTTSGDTKVTYNLEASGWLSDKYYELLWAVQTKYTDESRHETALRYIREAERRCSGPTKQSEVDNDV